MAAWEKLLERRSTVSVMRIAAHRDDEHGDVLANAAQQLFAEPGEAIEADEDEILEGLARASKPHRAGAA